MVAPPPSSFGVMRSSNDRDAIFGGPMSPTRNPVAGPSYLDSRENDDRKMLDGSEEFIEIKVRMKRLVILSDPDILIPLKACLLAPYVLLV
jgi:hypothetical protein